MATKVKNRLEKNGKVEVLAAGDKPAKAKVERLVVAPPNMRVLKVKITGDSPLMVLRFSQKSMDKMAATQAAGQQSNSRKKRDARDFDDDYNQAFHRLPDGSAGFPAGGIRSACISACRTCGFKMTVAKLSIFVLADGLDIVDQIPLVRINGTPKKNVQAVRNANGNADLRCRPVWEKWSIDLAIRFDMDQFSASDVFNLLSRAGAQVGLGEGRPDSRASSGIGYGLFGCELGK